MSRVIEFGRLFLITTFPSKGTFILLNFMYSTNNNVVLYTFILLPFTVGQNLATMTQEAKNKLSNVWIIYVSFYLKNVYAFIIFNNHDKKRNQRRTFSCVSEWIKKNRCHSIYYRYHMLLWHQINLLSVKKNVIVLFFSRKKTKIRPTFFWKKLFFWQREIKFNGNTIPYIEFLTRHLHT